MLTNENIVHCDCGRITGERCLWEGPANETVLLEHMPAHLRGSHRAARNWGCYPANGSERLHCERTCAESIVGEDADGYDRIVEVSP